MLKLVDHLFDSLSARLAQNLLDTADEANQNRINRQQAEAARRARLDAMRQPHEQIKLSA